MKKRNLQRIFAAFMATAMVVGATACDSKDNNSDNGGNNSTTPATSSNETTPATSNNDSNTTTPATTDTKPDDSNTTVTTPTPEVDPYANVDLGGMEIIVRDWWSPEEPAAPANDYEEARNNYRQEMMDKYNFKIRSLAISDWGSAPQDFVDYVNEGGDDKNYVFLLRNDPAVVGAMASGLMYDLSTIDCLDFSEEKYQQNRTHEMYSYGKSIYCFFAGPSEPRDGIFFNPNVLKEGGHTADEIYDMQANGTWTWEAFEKIMADCQKDTDGDGVPNYFGLCCNNGVCVTAAVISNGGEYVGKDANGKFTYRLEDPETTEALQWIADIFAKYNNHDPEGAAWDYYMQEFKDGTIAFMMDQEYQVGVNGRFYSDTPFTPGFVMFPKGPKAATYINLWDNNPHCIPGCYDAQRAWNIAFAFNLYSNPVPGYEDYNEYVVTAKNGIVDERAQDETIPMMSEPEHGTVTYHAVVPDMNAGPEFIWNIYGGCDVAAAQEAIRDTWKAYIDAANK